MVRRVGFGDSNTEQETPPARPKPHRKYVKPTDTPPKAEPRKLAKPAPSEPAKPAPLTEQQLQDIKNIPVGKIGVALIIAASIDSYVIRLFILIWLVQILWPHFKKLTAKK